MTSVRSLRITPATVISVAALFFALAGTSFAVGDRIQASTVAQQRCTNGAVRGVAVVTGNPSAGMANFPDRFTSAGNLFSRKFNCNGRAVQARRVEAGVFEVRFVGNAAPSAVGSAVGDAYADVEPVGGGVFRVIVHPAGRDDRADLAFTVVAV
ncbi:MAG: hypothetical protein ACRDPZ_05065 [Gaiellaceae bacterium]